MLSPAVILWILIPAALASPSVTPVRVEFPPTIDGLLDEGVWDLARPIGDLVQYNPQTGGPEFGTQVRVLYDDVALYFGFDVYSQPDSPLNAPLVPRDETSFHNWVGVVLDTYGDGQRGFVFRSSASGVQADAVMTSGDPSLWMMDMSWDGIYRSAARPLDDGDGYTVELAIPFRSLRYPVGEDQVWRLLVVHFTPTPWSVFTWPELSKEESNVLEQGGELGPFDPPRPRLPFEVLPTLTAGVGLVPEFDWTVEPGLSLKAGLTSGLTVDLALNPDYSQIEADPTQVTANLKYALYLQEKRPFFLEGGDYFDTPIEVFYSRSVVDPLLGVKLTGRAGPVPLGVLIAWDQQPSPSTLGPDLATGQERPGWYWDVDQDDETEVPTASVVYARTGIELAGGSSVGIMAVEKALFTPDGQRLTNTVTGADATFQFLDRWQASGQVLTSQTQLSDGDTLVGSAWDLRVSRRSETFFYGFSHDYLSPEFRAETGFLTEVDRVSVGTWAGATTYAAPFRFLSATLDVEATWNTAAELVEAEIGPRIETLVGERTYIEASLQFQREQYLDADFNLWSFGGFGGINPTSRSFVGLAWGLGPAIDYYADVPYRGFDAFAGYFAEGSLLGRLRLNYSGTVYGFWTDLGGELVYAQLINRLDSTLFMTPKLSVRAILEHDTWGQQATGNVLFAWKLNYGTAAYLGYQESLALDPLRAIERTVFAKIGVLYRPGEPIFSGARRRPSDAVSAAHARAPQVLASTE